MTTSALYPCGHVDPFTGAECDQPGKLYKLSSGSLVWICDQHAFPIEDLLKAVR